MQLVCYVGIAAEFRWVCAECQQRGFSNYRADQPAAWGTGISTFAMQGCRDPVRSRQSSLSPLPNNPNCSDRALRRQIHFVVFGTLLKRALAQINWTRRKNGQANQPQSQQTCEPHVLNPISG
jgi:hypothetical protein